MFTWSWIDQIIFKWYLVVSVLTVADCQAVRSYKSLGLVLCPHNFSHVEGDIFCSTEYIIHGALLVLDDAISQFDWCLLGPESTGLSLATLLVFLQQITWLSLLKDGVNVWSTFSSLSLSCLGVLTYNVKLNVSLVYSHISLNPKSMEQVKEFSLTKTLLLHDKLTYNNVLENGRIHYTSWGDFSRVCSRGYTKVGMCNNRLHTCLLALQLVPYWTLCFQWAIAMRIR